MTPGPRRFESSRYASLALLAYVAIGILGGAVSGCGARSELAAFGAPSDLAEDAGARTVPPPIDATTTTMRDATDLVDGSDSTVSDSSAADEIETAADAAADASGEDAFVDPPASVASALQIDSAHDGTIDDPLLVGPLTKLWSVTLSASISYPIIARDIVVVVSADFNTQAQLFAFHGHSGAPAWGPINLGSGPFGVATFGAATYENGRIFTTESDGVVRAFDIATGVQLWTTAWPPVPNGMLGGPPTAYDGIVYYEGVTGPMSEGLGALDEAFGRLLWQAAPDGELGSDPAVTEDGVFVSHACRVTDRYDAVSGATIWSLPIQCESGGGGWTPVVASGLVYARDPSAYVVQVSDGGLSGTLQTYFPPAVHAGRVFLLDLEAGVLQAFDSLGGTPAWTFGSGNLVTPPIVVSGRVFVGASDGTLYALDEHTGVEVWSDDAGVPFGGLDDSGFTDYEPAALGAAGGLLVAPGGRSLVVYGAIADGGAGDAAGDGDGGREDADVGDASAAD